MKKSLSMGLGLLLLTALFNLAACGDKSDDDLDCSKYNSTYDSNMKAIIDNRCISCHKTGGPNEQDGVYTDYNSMKSALDEMWHQVDHGQMPPVGSMTTEELEAWECWEKAGFPEN